jgi:hypothetical protein
MKKIILATSCISLLSGCATQETPEAWSIDCERNYSLSPRELAVCKERVQKLEALKVQSGGVTLNSANDSLDPGFDGKHRTPRP